MSITIPTAASQAWHDLIEEGLSTDEYSYLVFDVKKAETDPNKKVQVFMKVYVPEEKRKTATENVMAAMQKEGYAVEQRKSKNAPQPEIDIQITKESDNNVQKVQVIRVQFKPTKSSGSGGGSKQTTIQESAACLYNALRFHVFPSKNLTVDMTLTTEDLDKAFKYIDTPGATLDQIISFSADPDWKEVFMDGANKLYTKVSSLSKSKKDYIFVRGDKTYDDGLIKDAFNICKSSVDKHLRNEDKWNPSDIWMVSEGGKAKIEKTLGPYSSKQSAGTIGLLNSEFINLFNDGILIGVSLKKTGAAGVVKVVNNDTPEERRKTLGVGFKKDLSVNGLVYDSKRNFTGEHAHKRWPMDVYIKYGSGDKEEIQLRNFGGDNKGDWKLELKGKYAAMGKIQGSVARTILEKTGFSNIPQEPTWAECDPKTATKAQKKKITAEIYKLLDVFSADGFKKNDEAKMLGDIGIKRQSWRYSKLSGLRFLEYLCKSNVDADKAVKELYLFGGSQQDHASVYLKYS